MRLLKNKQPKTEEELLNLSFNVYKFNNRPKPKDKRRILIITSFSEFGCETVSAMYCIPKIIQQHTGYYVIVVGWFGREYLYKHLVDEFWELKEDFQCLRDFAKAFHNDSKNLAKLEENLKDHGYVYSCKNLAREAVYNYCPNCKSSWTFNNKHEACPKCTNLDYTKALFDDVQFWKRFAIKIPRPGKNALQSVEKYIKPKLVGITGRGRKTYGRNLQPEFYVKLIKLLEGMGYNPIWLGEKQSSLPCPVDHIVDFSRSEEAQDLEKTLAIVCNCEFTIQFWTASTRLAGMMGVPYLLFESPDQIFGNGQEGYRRNLCDFGPGKLCISHYLSIYNDHPGGLNLVKKCIKEMEQDNYKDVMGMVEDENLVKAIRLSNLERIGTLLDHD